MLVIGIAVVLLAPLAAGLFVRVQRRSRISGLADAPAKGAASIDAPADGHPGPVGSPAAIGAVEDNASSLSPLL
jgi:hypothetical protein